MYAKRNESGSLNIVPCLKLGTTMNIFCKNFLSEAYYLNQYSLSSTTIFEFELGDVDVTF